MMFMECSARNHEMTVEVFMRLAKEVTKRIDEGEIDPKNELLGVKLGGYRKEKETAGKWNWWRCF